MANEKKQSMISSFFRGTAQGCGIVFGLILMILLMQLSAYALLKLGVVFP